MEIGFFGFGDIKWYLRSFDRDERFWDLGVIGLWGNLISNFGNEGHRETRLKGTLGDKTVLKTLSNFLYAKGNFQSFVLTGMSHEPFTIHHQTQGSCSGWEPTWRICAKIGRFDELTHKFQAPNCVRCTHHPVRRTSVKIHCLKLLCVPRKVCVPKTCYMRRAGGSWTTLLQHAPIRLGTISPPLACTMIWNFIETPL